MPATNLRMRPFLATHNNNTHRMQVHEGILCSHIWRTVDSAWRRAAKNDVTVDIRLGLLSLSFVRIIIDEW